ncbi:M12 family metallo-peptidase [Stieleria sp. JC731]|uniref:Calx-beta domain-containing protein n=1 Tax=Pirellulaceae TaxID=2691357 RepID=UPI001E43EE37|nr:Calx-beta domain-containing protein [Stieleria sp. JC731]MCC9601569.1 M12 family metallo-peptidase [Stieleria sp. JC731]
MSHRNRSRRSARVNSRNVQSASRQPRRRLIQEKLESRIVLSATIGNNISVGDTLQNYRLAIAATEEYTAFFGGEANALVAIEDFVDDVNEIFEKELSIHFDLVSGTNTIFDTAEGEVDGYTNGNTSSMLSENTAILNSIVGASNYDIGHVFGLALAGGQGLAGLGVVNTTNKGRGASIHVNPQGESWVHLVAHEFGHQFGAEHTFNGNTYGSTVGQRSSDAAYEPASGSTLMSYAGISGQDDLQSDPDPYFHAASFEAIQSLIASTAPPFSTTTVSNAVPTVDGGADYQIPRGTPFKLSAVGSDADSGDSLSYTWEQLDLGPAMSLPLTDNGSSPLFRSFSPTTDPTRTFPRLADLAAGVNTAAIGEVLPNTARDLNFRATVRDGMGGVDSDDVLVSVINTSSPFAITSPNTAVNWTGGSQQTISWDTGDTELSPINTSDVSIDLSIDGGLTYPISILASTTNDGSEVVTIPNIDATNARIRVSAVGNVFFDISDADFSITSDPGAPGISVVESAGSTLVGEAGLLGSSPIDTYLLSLTTTPTSPIDVTVSADSQTEVSTDGISFSSSVTVTRSDMSAATIYVRGKNDIQPEGVHTGLIQQSVSSSSDANYPIGLAGNPVVATIADDELQPMIGVDFDQSGGLSPDNWTKVSATGLQSNLIREDGFATDVDLSFQISGSSGPNPSGSPTNPIHSPSLDELGGNYIATNSISLTWSGLDPGIDYNVYLLLTENFGIDVYQSIAISGETNLPTFNQDTRSLGHVLYVNESLASSSKTLEDDALTVAANASGEIDITITNIQGSDYAILAGAAIQLAGTPSNYTASLSVGTEGDESGPTDIVYTVTLNQVNDTGSTITFDLVDQLTGSATSGVDYDAIPGNATISIVPGSSTGSLSVPVVDDAIVEGPETVDVAISNPSDPAVAIVTAGASATISDNDGAPTLTAQFNADAISEAAGAGVTSVTITRNTDTSAPLDLVITNHDPSEISVQSTATIPAGSASITIPIDAVDDSYIDGNQIVNLTVAATTYDGSIQLDSSFGNSGITATTLRQNIQPGGFDILVEPNGNIVTGGRDPSLDDTAQILRLLPDGSTDTSFGSSGQAAVVISGETSVRPFRILRQDSGKFLVVGQYFGGSFLAQLNSNGTLDTTFDGDGTRTFPLEYFQDGLVHPDGSATIVSSDSVFRINSDGSLNASFGNGGIATPTLNPSLNESFRGIVEQSDGKYVIGGTASASGSPTELFTARLNADGSVDFTYGTNGYRMLGAPNGYPAVRKLELTSDGGVLVVGDGKAPSDWLLAKVDSSGDLDNSFGVDGFSYLDFNGLSDDGYDILIQDDGKILMFGGGFVSGNGNDRAIARFNENGSLDTTFSDDGFEIFDPFVPTQFEAVRAAAFTPDGNVVTFSGYTSNFQVERWIIPSGLAGSDAIVVTNDDVVGTGYLAGIDVDFSSSVPNNWTTYNYLFQIDGGNLLGEDGKRTPFDIQSDIAGSSFITTGAPTTSSIPQHTQSLQNIAGYSYNDTGNTFTSTISDLIPGQQYRLYVFAHETLAADYSQQVTFTGDNVVSFTQSLVHGQLHVNDSVGSDAAQLDTYAELVTANSDGEILIDIAPAAGSAGVVLSGLAIQHFVLTNDRLTVTINDSSISENGGATTATVTRNTGTSGNLTVTLTSSDTTEATVPSTVIIPDGSDSVTFTISGVDDADIDGDQIVTITAEATNFISDDEVITIVDDEILLAGPLIGIDFDSGTSPANWNQFLFVTSANATDLLAEDGTTSEVDILTTGSSGSTTGSTLLASQLPQHTQSLSGLDGFTTSSGAVQSTFSDLVPGAEYAVYVFAYEHYTATFVNNVTITGSNTDSFTQVPDSTLYVNGQIGSSSNPLESYASLIVADANGEIVVDVSPGSGSSGIALAGMALRRLGPPPARLDVSIDVSAMSENGGSATGTVSRNSGTTGDLTVLLSSSDTTEATVPASVVIPDGSQSVTFPITAVDDSILDGNQIATITAFESNHISGSESIDVIDDEFAAFGPFIGVDFNVNSNSPTPANWRSVFSTSNQTNLSAEDGSITTVGLNINGGVPFASTPNPATVPIHTPDLSDLEGQFYSSGSMSFTWVNLTPLSSYELYFFGLDSYANTSQIMTVVDAGGTTTIPQNFNIDDLFVNNTVGSSSLPLESYGITFQADGAGQIRIDLDRDTGPYTAIGGMAIREVSLATLFDADLSVSTHGDEAGPTNIVYTVTLDQVNDTGSAITFDIEDLGTGSATSGADYAAISAGAQVTIPDGASSGTYVVTVLDDGAIEPLETIDVRISNPSYAFATIVTSDATANITDNDVVPTLSLVVNAAEVSEGDGPAATTVTITRSVASPDPLTVTLTSSDTTEATVPTTATIPANQTSVTVNLDAIDDLIVDGTQNVTITANASFGSSGPVGLDTSFGTNGLASTPLVNTSTAIRGPIYHLPNGKILVGSQGPNQSSVYVAKLNADGSLDTSFASSGLATISPGPNFPVPTTIIAQPDGKILVGGRFISGFATPFLMRLMPDGSVDTSYGTNGIVDFSGITNMWIADMDLLPDGKVIATTSINGSVTFRMLRINADGTRDSSFGSNGLRNYSTIGYSSQLVKALPTGGFVAVGRGAGQLAILKMLPNGNIDTTFNSTGIQEIDLGTAGLSPEEMTIDSNDRILVSGYTYGNSIDDDSFVVRVNQDGTRDLSFNGTGILHIDLNTGEDDLASSVETQDDNKVVLVGYLNPSVGSREVIVTRFNADGTIDTTFDGDGSLVYSTSTYTGQRSYQTAMTQDGSLLVLGGAADDQRVAKIILTSGIPLTASDTLDVTDDDVAPADYAIIATDANKNEGDSGTMPFTFQITRSGNTSGATSVDWAVGGSAVNVDDFGGSLPSGTANFADGETSKTITIDISGDTLVEPDEAFDVTLSNATASGNIVTGTASGLIINDDESVVSVSVSPASVAEASGQALVYTFTRTDVTANTPALTVTFDVSGTASPSIDYSPSLGTSVSFAAGSDTATLSITPIDDSDVEPDETAILTLVDLAGYSLGTPDATGTITNDDIIPAVVSVTVAPLAVQEDGAGLLTYTFTRSGDTSGPLTVNYGLTGTATPGSDFPAPPTMSVDFIAGSATAEVIIDPSADLVLEPDETVTVSIEPGSGYVADAVDTATGTISNDDTATLTVGDVTIVEGGIAQVIISLDNAVQSPFDVDVSFVDGTAIGGLDFDNALQQVSFAGNAGEAHTLQIATIADGLVEPSETFSVQLSSQNSAVDDSDTATVTIEEAVLPVVSVSVDPSSVTEDSGQPLTFTFTRTDVTAQTPALEINFNIGGTAILGDDFTISDADHITFGVGEASVSVTVMPTVDGTIEPDETVVIAAVAGDGYVVAGNDTATATLLNDDLGGPPLQVANIVYFNQDAASEKDYSADGSGQRSIIRNVQITFSAPIAIPVGPVTDSSFALQVTSGRDAGDMIDLEVVSSETINGQQVVVLQFSGRSGIEPSSRQGKGGAPMLADANYRLTISGSVLGIDANGPGIGDDLVDDFFRLFGDFDADRDVDADDSDRFDEYYADGSFTEVFDFDGKPDRRNSDRSAFGKRYGTTI